MRLPEITPLQFALLSLLFDGEKTARQLRTELQRWGGPRAAATVSRLMSRIQYAAYVDSRPCNRPDHGRTVRECRYRLTDLGLIVWHDTRRFYNAFAPPTSDLQVVTTDEAQFAHHPPKKRRELVKRKYAKALQSAFRRIQPTLPR